MCCRVPGCAMVMRGDGRAQASATVHPRGEAARDGESPRCGRGLSVTGYADRGAQSGGQARRGRRFREAA